MGNATGVGERRDVSAVRRFLDLVDASHQNRADLARVLGAPGDTLTFTDLRALRLVAIGPTTVTGVAARLQVDLSRASRQIADLADLGLLARRSHPDDGRFSTILLTAAGEDVLNRWQAAWEQQYRSAVADWSPAELDRFGTLVDRFRRDLMEHQPRNATASGGADPVAGWSPRTLGDADDPVAGRLRPVIALADWIFSTAQGPAATAALVERSRSPIGPALIRVLGLVSRRGPLGIGELADLSGVVPSRASRHVQQLEGHRLVVRAVDPHDRRSQRIKATSKGTTLLRRIAAASETGLASIVADWPDSDVAELMAGFARLRAGLGQADRRAAQPPAPLR